ncbi:Zn-dependent amino- or carboxypeptidase, M28 family [Haloechinothrix alba]|uniref:Zn-dependent amino- or carboxypeptidase, M28 family n=1 Tax=Haloechinothrix alba TaxID=664784 RepID=A0A238WTM8_9PSEU|nr:M20/M25/M40 family metallo-hydrolase [Haloechinothrix alba]SNR49892.1 Zn-dependent amino- or carboxypeptidase, M28 family [Haloechinothrix alba]
MRPDRIRQRGHDAVRRRPRVAVACLAACGLTVALTSAGPAAADPNNNSPRKLEKAVTVDGVLEHLDRFQAIADANDGTRASGTPGYDASADYVAGQLEAAGYEVTRQEFEFPFFQELSDAELEQVSPDETTYELGEDFLTMEFSGSGDVTAPVEGVDLVLPPGDEPNTSTSGCEAADFAGFTEGNIALMQRGSCAFATKAANATDAGAAAAVIFNEGQPERTDTFAGTLGGTMPDIPVLAASFSVGADLADPEGTVARVRTDTFSETRTTENVFAETRHGRTDNVVMAGGHLDSVLDGPGYHDNGSASAALLEVALQMRKVKPNNQVRFAWWGAEESGLVGSDHYVANLSEQEIDDIALYINFDMIGSPNYQFGIYDGDDSDGEGAGPGPEGSAEIEKVFEAFFDGRDLPHEGTDFTGRSDYGPFIAVGIPAGGLFTGAEELKTPEQVERYGGVASEQLDPCYHAVCDSSTPVADGADPAVYAQLGELHGNVNVTALDVNSDAVANAVINFAFDTSAVNGERSPGKSHGAGNSEDALSPEPEK